MATIQEFHSRAQPYCITFAFCRPQVIAAGNEAIVKLPEWPCQLSFFLLSIPTVPSSYLMSPLAAHPQTQNSSINRLFIILIHEKQQLSRAHELGYFSSSYISRKTICSWIAFPVYNNTYEKMKRRECTRPLHWVRHTTLPTQKYDKQKGYVDIQVGSKEKSITI